MKTGQTSPSLGFAKNKYYARVVWVEESKNSLEFEIGPNYDDVPTRSQLLTGKQSSCTNVHGAKIIVNSEYGPNRPRFMCEES